MKVPTICAIVEICATTSTCRPRPWGCSPRNRGSASRSSLEEESGCGVHPQRETSDRGHAAGQAVLEVADRIPPTSRPSAHRRGLQGPPARDLEHRHDPHPGALSVPPVIKAFIAKYPEVALHMHQGTPMQIWTSPRRQVISRSRRGLVVVLELVTLLVPGRPVASSSPLGISLPRRRCSRWEAVAATRSSPTRRVHRRCSSTRRSRGMASRRAWS